jgi:hypothetical protein
MEEWPRHQIEVSGQLHAPGRFTSGETNHGTRRIGDWVGPRAGLDAVEKREISRPRRQWNPTSSDIQTIA